MDSVVLRYFVVWLLFFANSLFLPHGLLYSTLLTPVLIVHLMVLRKFKFVLLISALIGVFSIFHFDHELNSTYYLKSSILYFSIIVFGVYFYHFQKKHPIEKFFKSIVLINTFLFLIALLAQKVPYLVDYFWYTKEATRHMKGTMRLKLLTYEPSYYSLLLSPIFLYYLLGLVIQKKKQNVLPLILISIPLFMSLSFGIVGGMLLALFILSLTHLHVLIRKKMTWKVLGLGLIAFLPIYLLIFQLFPDNIINLRLEKIIAGHDTSANGRTYEAILVAYSIIENIDVLFGIGIGQIKNLGKEAILNFYKYQGEYAKILTIPNAFAETLAVFGVIGATLRILIQIILFLTTKVYENYYRLGLFIFLFIYQFTGSYITSVLEYILWILVFSASFKAFNKNTVSLNK